MHRSSLALTAVASLCLLATSCKDAEPDPDFSGTVGDGDGDGDGDGTGDGDGDGDGVTEDPMECQNAEDAGGFTFTKIAVWRDDATSAYSMIHDDMCGPALAGIHDLAVPALEERGLTAALGPFVQACDDASLWDVVAEAEAAGNEIVNHSYNHPEISVENAATEVTQAKSVFDENTANGVTFYIFPFDFWTDETLDAVSAAGHIGARAGSRDDNDGFDNPPINPSTPGNDMEIEFDVWPRTYSKYASWQEPQILSVHVWNGIEAGGWAVREFHSVSTDEDPPEDGSQGFGPVPLTVYEDHLDFLVDGWRSNQVWTSNPSTIIRYRHARTACDANVQGDTIVFDTSDSECTEFATPISVIVHTANDVPSVQGLQGGVPVSTRKLTANTFSVTADPTMGDVVLSGCADPGSEVDNALTLPPKPDPADSVCDLETVVGEGSPGLMDDLERPPEEFQQLPNPAQGDGRTGSWSWYPQDVTVEQVMEGDNTVLRYAGDDVGAWTGVTLAFLGGNGAGTCYDASAYTGIRFQLKGTVSSPDELNGKVILSLVTAETQTKTYGGDLDGEGGHFHKQVDVPADWQTIEIPWTDFDTPTWGDTLSLTDLAVGKLQAVDWGVTNQATTFEIFLDDIELY
jgi:hypothetical protein